MRERWCYVSRKAGRLAAVGLKPVIALLLGQQRRQALSCHHRRLQEEFSMLLRGTSLFQGVKTSLRIFTAASPRACRPAQAPYRLPVIAKASVQVRFFYKPNMAVRDPSTVSNYDAWLTKHTTANLKLDFKEKVLRGVVTLELESQTDKGSKEIILDSSYLSVSSVKVNSNESEWQVKERAEPLGSPVHISVPAGAAKSEVVKVDIELATTDKCTALQWLTAAQTSNNKAPFMFSQCQAIHARSLFPCQDTPDVKSTYSFRITSPHVVVASGVASGEPETQVGGDKLYSFEQKVPIPSYLFALASGDIATAPIGPRSLVATSPDKLDGAKWEFEHDMETFMEAAEKLVFPYQWGQYNVLVLPPSFPYGGMENPIYTFATPTVVSGDRQNVDVIAHELSHSWSGNLVTSCSWEHL